MDYQQLIDAMSPQLYRSLKRSLELGKWPDGRVLSEPQRATVMQAVIAWGEQHLTASERVGYIDRGHKAGDSCEDPQPTPLAWKN